ncbi:MAG TPA: hypothetical protein VFY71_01270 [Planctomycetota bacterium]|nr:hypothetical protein [Planctomycetota bacterium]
MTSHRARIASLLSLGLVVAACGGGGGGSTSTGGTSPGGPGDLGAVPPSEADKRVVSYATSDTDGSSTQTDLVDGGNPDSSSATDVAKQQNFANLITLNGCDYSGDGVPEPYLTGVGPGSTAGLILGANNLYDLFQTTTGPPEASLVDSPPAGFTFTGFTGGDIDSAAGGDATGDGGAGLFTNVPGSTGAKLPVLPNTMGLLSASGSGRGPSATDQHQFIQIVFPYKLDTTSLFNPLNATNSYLGDSAIGASDNVFIEARWIETVDDNAVDQTFQHRHVSGVAIIGGQTAVPTGPGLTSLATIDPVLSNLPAGCQARVMDPNVFTYIAHEDPTLITTAGSASTSGFITGDGVLVLPNPTTSAGGGRVFGANTTVPGSVNDFGTDGDEAAAVIGFFSVNISRLRSQGNGTIDNPYFHTYAVNQSNVGADPRSVNGTFNRGPAIYVNENTSVPAIDLLYPNQDAIGVYNPTPPSDITNLISTRARFLVKFDREVVPNSVGFSRKYTIHSSDQFGIMFPFNGNSRPVPSPSSLIQPGQLGAPLAASIYLAVNQQAGVNKAAGSPTFGLIQKVNSLSGKSPSGFDDGTAFTSAEANGNGLNPQQQNTLATMPRGTVPCDIYPLNQNNLNAFVVEPLVELPPGSIVTLGVCVAGLGFSQLEITDHGNQTRSGVAFTPFQGLSSVGLGEDASQKTAIIGDDTIIKVNAGPMDLQGQLCYGGTTVAVDTLLDGDAADDTTTGGFNICRTFRVGTDNEKLYVNAPVSPQALYLAYNAGGMGILDLNGTGYNTNKPGGANENEGYENYLEVSRYLPTKLTGNLTLFNYKSNGSFAGGEHFKAYGILGRFSSGGATFGQPPGVESELALGAAIPTGLLTPVPGINEGSSGYESLVRTGIVQGKGSTATQVVAPQSAVGVARDIEVGQFLDAVYFDEENPFSTPLRHRTYNTPLQGSLDTNSIADPPEPNPPPLRFPVGLPQTSVIFDQTNLKQDPFVIEGNEVWAADGFIFFDDGTGIPPLTRPINGFIQLNPTSNESNKQAFDVPQLPNPGFSNPFQGFGGSTVKFVHTGPMPKTCTSGAFLLAALNAAAGPGTYDSGGLVAPVYQSRQQIGNFLFVSDGVNKKLHVLNSNTMEVIQSLKLPDPYGLGLSPELETLYVSNEGDNSMSAVDADPTSATFMTELKRIPVGSGPRAVAVSPNHEDIFVLNYLGNTISIVDIGTLTVRRTLAQNGIDKPYDIAIGARETASMPGFGQGTYHGFISNFGGDNILIYESGPTGLAGIGFDNIIGSVAPNKPLQAGSPIFHDMFQPRGITYDPVMQSTDVFSLGGQTPSAFVAHKDQDGHAIVSRIAYTKDSSPGQTIGNFLGQPGFGDKVFEVTAQYLSQFTGVAYDVALPDYNRDRVVNEDFGTYYNLFNAGCTPKTVPILTRNAKFPTADNILPTTTNSPRWEPDRLYMSVSGKVIVVFDVDAGTLLKTITTPQDVSNMASYFSQ